MAQSDPLAKLQLLRPVAGMAIATAASGTGYRDRPDLLLTAFDPGTTVAGVLTTSRTAAAPLRWTRERLARNDLPRGLVVNAGNANCYTGAAGVRAVEETAMSAAMLLKCRAQEIYIASTGTIGRPLDTGKLGVGLAEAHAALGDDGWITAPHTIMTTDRQPKSSSTTVSVGGAQAILQGITKGCTMITPNMATTLSFLFTDARLPTAVLTAALREAVDATYNMISVDISQSTNDTILIFATGAGEPHAAIAEIDDQPFQDFRAALQSVLRDLSQQILLDAQCDGVRIEAAVRGAASEQAARRIARCIVNSLQIRSSALNGVNFRLGPVIAAVGMAGEAVDVDRLTLKIGGETRTRDGAFVGDTEVPRTMCLRDGVFSLSVDVGVGEASAIAYSVAHDNLV